MSAGAQGNGRNPRIVRQGGGVFTDRGAIGFASGGDAIIGGWGTTSGAIRGRGRGPDGDGRFGYLVPDRQYRHQDRGRPAPGQVARARRDDPDDERTIRRREHHPRYRGNLDGAASGVWLQVVGVGTGQDVVPVPNKTEGIVTLSDGDVFVRTGGDFNCQTGTFGHGDLTVYAGGDLNGRFLVRSGTGTLNAMGNFGSKPSALGTGPQLIEMSAASVNVSAQGNIELGAVVNPTLAEAAHMIGLWDVTYTPDSSISLTAVRGDVNLYGTVDGYGTFYSGISERNMGLSSVGPHIRGRNINIDGHSLSGYYQLPSATGNLTMSAGKDIVFLDGMKWTMSDADPAAVYVPSVDSVYAPALDSHGTIANRPLHYGDPTGPVVITAGGGVTDMDMTVPKAARINAGSDITDLAFVGQNIGEDDVTSIVASGAILYGYRSGGNTYELIQIGGPGTLLVQAGKDRPRRQPRHTR